MSRTQGPSNPLATSPDFNVGDLAILQSSPDGPRFHGALVEIVGAEHAQVSWSPVATAMPAEALYLVRVVAPAAQPVELAVARARLRPLYGAGFEGRWPEDVTQFVFRRARRRHCPDDKGRADP